MKFQSFLMLIILTSLCLGCSQQTKNLYRLELERACVDCNLKGVNLSKQNLGTKYRLPRGSSPLSVTPFGIEEAEPVDLTRANLTDANLFQADLTSVIFNEANLQQANLSETDLQEAQLKDSNLQAANLQQANLNKANLFGANLQGADLRGAKLEETNLTGIITNEKTIWDKGSEN
ncbi:MAG: pentapeptide repeat-containing protein [Cyanobacteria bacterium P01_G01_bin.49]